MKIALYSPTVLSLDGGIENFILNVGSKLSKYCKVNLLAGQPLTKRDIKVSPSINLHKFDYIRRVQMEKIQRKLAFPMECGSFFANSVEHLIQNKYDLVHVHKPTDIILKPYLKSPLVVHLHDETIKKQAFLYKKYQADMYIACSEYIAKKDRSLIDKKAKVLHNGVDPVFFSPKRKKKKKRKQIFTIGRLVKYKGFDRLIKAFKIVEKENKEVDLCIGGRGIFEGELMNLAKKLKIKNLTFLGHIAQKKLPYCYSDADVFVNTRIREPFGMVFLESMACGTPVIAGREGGPNEFVTSDIGFLNDNSDHKEIAKTILKALDSDLDKMGENARKRIEKDFTWDIVSKKLFKMYEKVV